MKPKGLGLIIAVGKPKDEPMNDAQEPEQPQDIGGTNILSLGDEAYPDGQDGQEVETRVKGKLTIRDDGKKFLSVISTDGVPVQNTDEEADESPEEESQEDESTESDKPDYSMRADEALDQFMKSKQNEE